MSAPIDQLIISVEIEEGSNLEELYNHLKDIQNAGGVSSGTVNVDTSKLATRKQIENTHKKLNDIQKSLNDIVAKFPSLTGSVSNIYEENMRKSLKVMANLLRRMGDIEDAINDFSEEIKIKINEIVKFLNKKVVLEKSQDLKNIAIMNQEIISRLDELKGLIVKLDARIPAVRGHVTNKAKEIIRELTKQIKNISCEGVLERLDELDDSVNDLKDLIKNDKQEFMNFLHDEVQQMWQAVAVIEQGYLSFDVFRDMLSKGLKEMQDSFENFAVELQKLLDKEVEPEKQEEQEKEIFQLIQDFFESEFERIFSVLEDLRVDTDEHARRSDYHGMQKRFSELESFIREKYLEILRDWETVDLEYKNIQTKLNKITTERTDTRRIIKEYYAQALTNFKGKLDENLKSVITDLFNHQTKNLQSVFDEVVDKIDELITRELNAFVEAMKAVTEAKRRGVEGEELNEIFDDIITRAIKKEQEELNIDDLRGLIALIDEQIKEVMGMHPSGPDIVRDLTNQKIALKELLRLAEKKETAQIKKLIVKEDLPVSEDVNNILELLAKGLSEFKDLDKAVDFLKASKLIQIRNIEDEEERMQLGKVLGVEVKQGISPNAFIEKIVTDVIKPYYAKETITEKTTEKLQDLDLRNIIDLLETTKTEIKKTKNDILNLEMIMQQSINVALDETKKTIKPMSEKVTEIHSKVIRKSAQQDADTQDFERKGKQLERT